jgi:nitric oxide dioxygenase
MTPKQVALVQDSFAKVAPTSEAAAVLFYDRLFEIVPQMRAMFPDDMIEQRSKLMAMLAAVVKGLGNLEQVLPAASALAKRHVGHGVKAEHYPVVGAALLCGRWRRAWGMPGRRKWRMRGAPLMARCPAT